MTLTYFPIDELKSSGILTGEDYIAKVSKHACLGIFKDTKENVNDHAEEKIDELENNMMERFKDQ